MQDIDIRITSSMNQVRSLCGVLGSYDPLHKGHEWIAEKLLEQFDAVLLLIPAFHFEKTVRFPLNATLEQRLEMLTTFSKRKGNRGRPRPLAVGLTHEVLFIRLADRLSERFPSAEISFGMGNETYEKVLASKAYYDRLGLPWTAEDQAKLERLQKRIVVFGRSQNNGRFISVPKKLHRISSTRIRETVMDLRRTCAPEAIWQERLEQMISPEILTFISQKKLYVSI
jgi:cytidyltransferase-like protein